MYRRKKDLTRCVRRAKVLLSLLCMHCRMESGKLHFVWVPFFLSTQAQVKTRILGPLLVVLVDWAWFTAVKWGLITNQVVCKSHKAPQGKMRFLLSNKISL